MAAPERFAEKSDLLLQRGYRPYMATASVSATQRHGGPLQRARGFQRPIARAGRRHYAGLAIYAHGVEQRLALSRGQAVEVAK